MRKDNDVDSKSNKSTNNNRGGKSGKSRSNKGYNRNGRNKGCNHVKDEGSKFSDGDINNPAYYYEDPNVLSQVMNFSFNEFGGVPFSLESDGVSFPVHNIMISTIALNPSIPESTSAVPTRMDGTTTAAIRNFLALSGSNAKTTTYAPQDVEILTLAIAELIKCTTYCARAFGVAYLFNYRNRSYPEMLLEAMGVNADDFSKHLADYRVRFNKLLTIASKIPFPADIPLFRKSADLYAYIYLDDPNSALAQTYMFVPYSTWLFNEAYDSNGAGLETFSFVQPTSTMGDILDRLEQMISALVNSTSLNSIYSDVMRLVQNGKISQMITFKSIPEDFVVVPIYNEEVRDWLHNAIIVGHPIATADQYYDSATMEALTNLNDVSCDANTNRLLYHPQFALPNGSFGSEAVIDFTHDNVSLEDRVRATRLSQRFTWVKDSNNKYYTNELAFIDNYIVEIWYWTGENDIMWYYLNQSYDDLSRTGLTPQTVSVVSHTLSKFDWAPLYYFRNGGQFNIIGDLDYYTTLDFKTLKKIYDYEVIHLLQIG